MGKVNLRRFLHFSTLLLLFSARTYFQPEQMKYFGAPLKLHCLREISHLMKILALI